MQGKVKWWNSERGYGFITGDDQEEYFAHYKQIVGHGRRDLVEGWRVDFEPVTDPVKYPKGPVAEKIVGL